MDAIFCVLELRGYIIPYHTIYVMSSILFLYDLVTSLPTYPGGMRLLSEMELSQRVFVLKMLARYTYIG